MYFFVELRLQNVHHIIEARAAAFVMRRRRWRRRRLDSVGRLELCENDG